MLNKSRLSRTIKSSKISNRVLKTDNQSFVSIYSQNSEQKLVKLKSSQLNKSLPHAPNNFIDRQMFQIVQEKAPNRLAKFIRQRTRIRTQQSSKAPILDERHSFIFKQTYQREKLKMSRSLQRSRQTKIRFFKKLGLNQPKPVPFFQMRRQDIMYMQKRHTTQFKSMRKGQTSMHPINTIYEASADQVYKRRRVPKSVMECKPFDDVKKINYF